MSTKRLFLNSFILLALLLNPIMPLAVGRAAGAIRTDALVLVNGDFFSAGRLPRGKLRKLLDRLLSDGIAVDRSERVG